MEAPEVPLENLHEELHHHAEHASPKDRWITGVALSSAIIAALAAVASLLAGANANEAMILQMQASDQWNYYQAKGVKSNVLTSKIDLLTALGKTPDPKDRAKAKEYKEEQVKIQDDANHKQHESTEHLENHETMAKAVTVFQVAIAVGAVAALTRRRSFWYVSLVAAAFGTYVFGGGLVAYSHMQASEKHEAAAEGAKEGGGGGGEHASAKAGEHEKPAGEHAKPAGESAEHAKPAEAAPAHAPAPAAAPAATAEPAPEK